MPTKMTLKAPKAAPAKNAKATKPAARKTGKKGGAKPKQLSAIAAAAKLLAETKEPMNCKQMIEAMAAQGLWTSSGGKTPSQTLFSAIAREISERGKDARFKKTERGKFAANG